MNSALNLTMALCTAALDQRNLASLILSVYPSPCKVTICVLRTSVKEMTERTIKMTSKLLVSRLTVPWPKLDNAIITLRHLTS